jgi:hypothetical protein
VSIIGQVASALQTALGSELDTIGRRTGAIQRQRKFSGATLFKTVVLTLMKSRNATTDDFVATAAQVGVKVTSEAVDLLVLNYSNASVSLPRAVADPDLDFLAVTLAIVSGLCVLAFASGWSISRLLKASPARRTSLMFGLGMNNNGTGLVLASLALAHHPRVMLPIISYNLVQHLVAGLVDRLFCRTPPPRGPAWGERVPSRPVRATPLLRAMEPAAVTSFPAPSSPPS